MDYSNLLSRLVNTPLLVTPARACELLAFMTDRMEIPGVRVNGEPLDYQARLGALGAGDRQEAKFENVSGIAVIPVQGTLVNKGGWLDAMSGLCSYEFLSMKLRAAVEDSAVRGIVLDIDSPGGEVAGCFDFSDQIRAAREKKPIWAICTESALSGAYAIASQASRIVVPRTGFVGSIGVLTMHGDFSELLKNEGIKITLIHAGAHKVDGNPYEPLPKDVLAEVQARVESVRQLFADTVAAGLGVDAKTILETEARIFQGQDGVKAGLAHEVAAPNDAFNAFLDSLDGPRAGGSLTLTGKDNDMTFQANDTNDKHQPAVKADAKSEKKNDKDKDAAEDEDDDKKKDSALAADKKKGAEDAAAAAPSNPGAERVRIKAIVGSDEAKGREALAQHLAFDTDTGADAAVAILKASPKGDAGGLDARMMGHPNPDVGPGGEGAGGDSADADPAAACLRAYSKATGTKIEGVNPPHGE